MPFEIVSPQVHNITVAGTKVSAQMRTVSGTSLDTGSGKGVDLPFSDEGFETITLNKTNYLNTPRLIGSRINETSNSITQQFPGDRSFNMRLNLESNDSRISPIIDSQRASLILTSNRCDSPVLDHADDPRVSDIFADPSACQYISKENVLENSASSIKIILDAHVNTYNDIRAFYAISDTTNFEPRFIPFPGFTNLDVRGEVVDKAASDGRPDSMVPYADASGFVSSELTFKEFNWNATDLPQFLCYRIKIVLSSTNQVYVPRISNLRVLTLA